MIIKICGIRDLVTAQAAKEAGADWLGLVFASSRRQVTVKTARRICESVKGVAKVGLFVNAPLREVEEISQFCRLDYVQLHGDETPAYCRQLSLPVIKALRVGHPDFAAAAQYKVNWLLLDSFVPGQYGGTGTSFSWEEARPLRTLLATAVMLAGGLTPDNVGQAIDTLTPQGVDVSGGVETAGVKDLEKIYRFVAAVRKAQNHAGM